MRSIVVTSVLLVAAAVAARADDSAPPAPPPPPGESADAKERTFAEGRLTDPWWALSLELPGLAEQEAVGGAALLFAGKAGEATVEILVEESDRERSAADWRADATKAWVEKQRKMTDRAFGTRPVPWETFVEKSAEGAERHHGYAFHVRGLQLFTVHAWANARTATSGAELTKAITALKLGADRGASVVARMIATRAGRPPDSTEVTLAAAQMYLLPRAQRGGENPAMAESVLTKALLRVKEGDLGPDEFHVFHEFLGLATLTRRNAEAAIGWFARAAELAAKTSRPDEAAAVSTYNLACAYSVAGKADEAFAALELCFAKGWPVDLEHLRTDADLENLRKDPRWTEFLARRAGDGGAK